MKTLFSSLPLVYYMCGKHIHQNIDILPSHYIQIWWGNVAGSTNHKPTRVHFLYINYMFMGMDQFVGRRKEPKKITDCTFKKTSCWHLPVSTNLAQWGFHCQRNSLNKNPPKRAKTPQPVSNESAFSAACEITCALSENKTPIWIKLNWCVNSAVWPNSQTLMHSYRDHQGKSASLS